MKIKKPDVQFKNKLERYAAEHEIFISFSSDWMAEPFEDWFYSLGIQQLNEFIDANKDAYH